MIKKETIKEFLKIFKISVPLIIRNPVIGGGTMTKELSSGASRIVHFIVHDNERALERRTTRITTEFLVAWSHNGISTLSRNWDVATRRNDQVNF